MIIITGAAGFIGSCFLRKLNDEGLEDLFLVDQLDHPEKKRNLEEKRYTDYLEKDDFLPALLDGKLGEKIEAIFHLGACSSTTETNAAYLTENNYEYSKKLAEFCFSKNIYFSYASSAATYGDGSEGYSDRDSDLDKLKPLNLYGESKHHFDLWLRDHDLFKKVIGFKFFNVFGPNEYHKGEMRSVVCKAYEQIRDTGSLKLFKSHRPDYKDGEQKRDFVYIQDVVDFMFEAFERRDIQGLFNLGTGEARTWNDLATAVFRALNQEPKIEYIDMPDSIREKYQYFTEADMTKTREAGFKTSFRSLEDAVSDYVQNYLAQNFKCL